MSNGENNDFLFTEPTEGEMLQQYATMLGGLPGSTPAQRMNYFQDIMSTMKTFGVDPRTLLGPSAPEPMDPFVEQPNATEQMYGGDPLYATIFKAIVEQGMSPIQAAKLARDQVGWTPSDPMASAEEFNRDVVQVATQFARDEQARNQARVEYDARAAANTGKPSALATASEYDLLGAPDVDTLMAEYVRSKAPLQVAYSSSSKPRVGRSSGASVLDFQQPAPSDKKGRGAPPAGMGQPHTVRPTTLAGGDYYANKVAKDSIRNRVNQAKNTRVRSDANNQAMNTLLAMAGMLQGGFPD